MNKGNVNFKHFKKIASDKDSATLKHPNGHELKIAKNRLSPSLRDQLEKLPMAKGGMVKRYAEGTPDEMVSPEDQPTSDGISQTQSNQAPAVPDQIETKPQGVNININAQPPAPAAQAAAPVAVPAQQAPVVAPVAAPQTGLVDQNQAAIDSIAKQVPAEQPEDQQAAPVSDQAAQNQAAIESIANQPDTSAPKAPPSVKQEMTAETQAFQNDLQNGHIQPKTLHDYYASKSTPGKIGMLFGLMLGGIGSGLTHQPSAYLQIMQKEIDNDLEAQKQSKANAMNFISVHQHGQMNDAQIQKLVQDGVLTQAQANLANAEAKTKTFGMAQINMLQDSYHSLVQQMQAMPEGPQKEQAKQMLGFIYKGVEGKINNVIDQAAGASEFYKTLFGNSSSSSNEQSFQQSNKAKMMLGPEGKEMSKYESERHFPGLKGQASIPLSPDDRNQMNSGMEFDQKLHRFIDWTKSHSGDLKPQDRSVGQALASELQGSYRQATHGGVYKEGEQNFISKLIDSTPTKFFNEVRVLPQLNALANENQSRVNQLVKSKGFEGYTGAGKVSSPQDKKVDELMSKGPAPEFAMKNGMQYQKTNGGWQKVK